MLSKYFSILSVFFFLCFLTNCENESKVFLGEWQDARSPENVWKVTKSGSTFKGVRVSGEDFYKYDSEEWKFEVNELGFPTLVPTTEGGSTLMFQLKQNRVLRSPPGRAYVKVVKAK